MIVYVHSTDGMTVNSGISLKPRDGWLPCIYEPPKSDVNEVCICSGFVKDGERFRATFDVIKVEDEATSEDKDAALRRFGVEV